MPLNFGAEWKTSFGWPNLKGDLKTWVRSCTCCAFWRRNSSQQLAPLQPIPYPERPWQLCAADLLYYIVWLTDNDNLDWLWQMASINWVPVCLYGWTQCIDQTFPCYLAGSHSWSIRTQCRLWSYGQIVHLQHQSNQDSVWSSQCNRWFSDPIGGY